jgi:rod shape determining protein RodA
LVLLTLVQPDLGTAIILGVVFISMVLMGGLRLRSFAYLVAAGLAFLPIAWQFLKTYQRNRILTFLDPDRDPLGAGYHVIQSQIAIGSGKIFGKGFMHGTQNRLNFLPEQHTDFIFRGVFRRVGIGRLRGFTAALLCLDRLLYPLGATG